jgi:diguanylate cyclase (GGDEF)-like protein
MNDLLSHVGASTHFGPTWPAWIAAGGFVLFCLLSIYAALMLFAGDKLPMPLRFIQMPSLRGRMVLGFVLAGTLPAISLTMVLSERASDERMERTALMLGSEARNIAGIADYFLQKAAGDLDAMGQHVMRGAIGDPANIAARLREAPGNNPGFQTIMVLDGSGAPVTTMKMGNREFEIIPNRIESVGEREYFLQPMENGERFFSPMIEEPALYHEPTTIVSVPLRSPDGELWGVLAGVYRPASFSRLQAHLGDQEDTHSVLLDRDGRVVFATDSTGFKPFDDLNGKSILSVAHPPEGEIFHFRHSADGTGRETHLGTHFCLQNGWTIYLFRSLDELEVALIDQYSVALAWLLGTLIIAVCLALATVNGISGPLEALDRSVRDFELSVDQKRPAPPDNAPREVLTIFEHLGSLEKRLRATYRKLRKAVKQGEKLRAELIYAVSNREKEVARRTEELKEANETLQRLSREDSLTGLANRRWFAQFLARTWQGSIRDKQPICILIIDIDDFKAYNDHYGHQRGDKCLKLVSEAIRLAAGRASDLVSRYGGEEFVVVLGQTSLEGGLRIAENIRADVERLRIPHQGSKKHHFVTVSIGVTSTLPAPDIQPATILVAADRAMYMAKNEGKNQVAYSTTAGTGIYQALCMPSNTESRPS